MPKCKTKSTIELGKTGRRPGGDVSHKLTLIYNHIFITILNIHYAKK